MSEPATTLFELRLADIKERLSHLTMTARNRMEMEDMQWLLDQVVTERAAREQAEARLVESIKGLEAVRDMDPATRHNATAWEMPQTSYVRLVLISLSRTTPSPLLAELTEARAQCAEILGALSGERRGAEKSEQELAALKLKLEVAKEALRNIEHSGTARVRNQAQEALSQLNESK